MNKGKQTYTLLIQLLLFLIFSVTSVDRSYSQADQKIQKDISGKVQLRTSPHIDKYLNDDAYLYDTEASVSPTSLLERIWFWIMSIIYELLFRISEGGNVVAYIFYGIMLFLLVFIILKLIGLSPYHVFLRTRKVKFSDIPVFEEDINALDIEKIISDAINSENYRTAVRFLYIKLLKILSYKEYIEWKPEKTNKDYFYEMQNNNYIKEFIKLTRIYEYVWYGEFRIKRNFFNSSKNNFDTVYRNLNA